MFAIIKIEMLNCKDKQPIDYVLKEKLDECYISIHNFVSFNSSSYFAQHVKLFKINEND